MLQGLRNTRQNPEEACLTITKITGEAAMFDHSLEAEMRPGLTYWHRHQSLNTFQMSK